MSNEPNYPLQMNQPAPVEICLSGPLAGWPQWAADCPVVWLTQREIDALPEYSCTLPDSYRRPIAEGGRPWKRDLNFFGRFGTGKKWVRCEYVRHPNPRFLGIKNERVEIVDELGPVDRP